MTRQITAAEFKAKCLKLMDEVAATGEAIVITKRGKPIARLEAEKIAHEPAVFGRNLGGVTIVDPDDDLEPKGADLREWADHIEDEADELLGFADDETRR